ncbi:MAG TPA: hypothetical protein VIT91_05685 [Chthoniobacterales bacterium]
MKSNAIKHFTLALVAAFFTIVVSASAQGGRGGHETYLSVKTKKQAEGIKPGERVAISCGNCGAFTIFIVDKDRSYLQDYTCHTCKRKFVVRTNPHGGTIGYFVYEDKAGHESHLLLSH